MENKLIEEEKENAKEKVDGKDVLSKIMIICFIYKILLNRPHFIKIDYVFLNNILIKCKTNKLMLSF